MIYVVELRIRIDGIGVIQFNEYRGKYRIEERIQKWIFEVRKEYGYREMIVEKVTLNDEDITEKIAPTRNE
jgi:hypothetical protein